MLGRFPMVVGGVGEMLGHKQTHRFTETAFAASRIAATVTSGCAIMLGWSPPGTW
jgi:hypothetical protein